MFLTLWRYRPPPNKLLWVSCPSWWQTLSLLPSLAGDEGKMCRMSSDSDDLATACQLRILSLALDSLSLVFIVSADRALLVCLPTFSVVFSWTCFGLWVKRSSDLIHFLASPTPSTIAHLSRVLLLVCVPSNVYGYIEKYRGMRREEIFR